MLAKQKRLADHFNLLSFDDAQKGRELEPKKKQDQSHQPARRVCM